MSRIRGIDAKLYKDILQTRRNGYNENNKIKSDDRVFSKDNGEKQQIKELLHKLPKLDTIFNVHRKIGEGTFSSVYLGSLRQHMGLPEADKQWFAIKHLVPTSHPARIEQELRCLQDMGGRNHVIGVELCLRHLDTIVFIMPYIPHRKFSEYVADMDAEELKQYMRALLIALKHVHSFGVIHRDVKPSNFLYDRQNRRYLLVDFGLAQRVVVAPGPAPLSPAAPATPPLAHLNSFVLKRARVEEEPCTPDAKRVALDLSVGAARASVPVPAQRLFEGSPEVQGTESTMTPTPAPNGQEAAVPGTCACAGVGGVCGACAARPQPRAPRAGTQGFRPPEVLLKYAAQSTAVDMWAAGVVLASVLCARYPFLRAPDDAAALAELADLLGTSALHRAARTLGRRLVTSSTRRGLCLRKLCARLRRAPPPAPAPRAGPPCEHCRLPREHCLCRDDATPAGEFVAGAFVAGFPDSAFALAARLLEPEPRARISAASALLHPFLAD